MNSRLAVIELLRRGIDETEVVGLSYRVAMSETRTTETGRLLLLSLPIAFVAGLLVMGTTLWLLAANGLLVADGANDAMSEESGTTADAALAVLPIGAQNELDYLNEEIEAGRERMRLLELRIGELAQLAGQEPASSNSEALVDSGVLPGRFGEQGGDGTAANGTPGGGTVEGAGATGDAGAGGGPVRRDYDRLVAVGVDTQTAGSIQSRIDEQELARLELIDQASREGWRDSDEFEQRLEELDEAGVDLRDELGDDDYDRYLFEAGRSNRVGVGSVISGSAADQAGLQAGDEVVAYADDRVFASRELQGATRSGERGELVQVVVRRDGSELVLSVPRGPLGITLRPQRIEP